MKVVIDNFIAYFSIAYYLNTLLLFGHALETCQ